MTSALDHSARPTGRRPDPEQAASHPATRPPRLADRLVPALNGAVLLLTAVLLLMVLRLPWIGDMGVHLATIERLRHDLLDPGNTQVAADTPSPYNSPWMVLLGVIAKVSGLSGFMVLRGAALVGLVLLLTGIWHLTRSLSRHRAAPPLAVLTLILLWGPTFFIWSGFLGFTSISLNISYPSTFATGLGFHFLALLAKALRRDTATSWAAWTGLGALWALIMLSHQFTGVVITFGAMGVLISVRPWPTRQTWLRLGTALAAAVALLALWPYYNFFSLLTIGGLEDIHRGLYDEWWMRFGYVLIGVVALAFRFARNRRDPLVWWFLLAALMITVGGLTGHYSWGRALPGAIIPAQLAAALAVVEGGGRFVRRCFAVVLAAGLLAGSWAQAPSLSFVVRSEAMPQTLTKKAWLPIPGYQWMTKYAGYGDVVMVDQNTGQQIPGYGFYTVAPGYPDFFLPDEPERIEATRRYFDRSTPRQEKLDALHRFGAQWVLGWPDQGLPPGDPALRKVKTGPNGMVLYKVVG
ncbi:hypothetical protein [Streptomyces sp. NPDC002054]|uniref:hypothetical protein n=1 Tax=Streptomyces sp. NPDC002054 TaxID=3154663 RepID=UPI00331B9DFE